MAAGFYYAELEVRNLDTSYIVYCHTNKINGKKYVGITKNKAERRWGSNGSGYNPNFHFGAAIAKYGWDNFHHEILFSDLSEQEAKDIEVRLIREWNLQDNRYGYNLTGGGDGFLNPTDETRKKMSDAAKTTERLAALEKNRELARAALIGTHCSEERKRKISEANKGRRHTEESKRKMSDSLKGRVAWNKGVPCREETKNKLSEIAKRRPPQSEETRRKRSESLRRFHESQTNNAKQ